MEYYKIMKVKFTGYALYAFKLKSQNYNGFFNRI